MPRWEPLSVEERFFSHVGFDGPVAAFRPDLGQCWLWMASTDGKGYGVTRVRGRLEKAHRVAWGLAGGHPAPPGLKLEHFACGVRLCVNPGHVRPKVARDSVLGARFLAAWNMRHRRCVEGHLFTSRNVIFVPGGRACRQCRRDVERARR